MRLRLPRSRRQAVSTHDLRSLRRGRLRAGALRVVLAGGAVALLGAAAASARGLDVRERSFLPPGSTGVVVVDVSLSIAEGNYVDVRRTLRQLMRIDAPIGLVFSRTSRTSCCRPALPHPSSSRCSACCSRRSRRPRRRSTRGGTRTGPARGSRPRSRWRRTRSSGTRSKTGSSFSSATRDGARGRSGNGASGSGHPEKLDRHARRAHVGFGRVASPLRRAARTEGVRALPRSEGEERRFENALASGVPTGLLVLGGLLFALLALHEHSGRLALPRARGSKA